jgi:hypothetical protein
MLTILLEISAEERSKSVAYKQHVMDCCSFRFLPAMVDVELFLSECLVSVSNQRNKINSELIIIILLTWQLHSCKGTSRASE